MQINKWGFQEAYSQINNSQNIKQFRSNSVENETNKIW